MRTARRALRNHLARSRTSFHRYISLSACRAPVGILTQSFGGDAIMRRTMCKSKVHRAVLTGADLHYEGSLTLDAALMEAADILPFEKVQVVNVNNGSRLETYVIEGERNSGTIQLNGAAARLGAAGDHVIVISYADYEERELENFEPKLVFVDEKNRIVREKIRRAK
jgi:aspartate 1-decarboxylase